MRSQEEPSTQHQPGEVVCPLCHRSDRQIKSGINGKNQRYKCQYCCKRYTPRPVERGYPQEVRERAQDLRRQGHSTLEISAQLGVSVRSVRDWVRDAPVPDPIQEDDRDEPLGARRRRSTIEDVARVAGVSVATVSNCLNGKGRMSPATEERVRSAIADLHFSRNAHIRAIRQRRTNVIGVLTFGMFGLEGDVVGVLTPGLLQGISNGAWRHRQEILIYTGWPSGRDHYSSASFLNAQIDGLVWIGPALKEKILEEVSEAGLAVVAVMSRRVPDGVGYVCCDNIWASSRLTNHLIELGHRRIAFVGAKLSSDFLDRRDGYRMALAQAGLKPSRSLEAVYDWHWPRYVRTIEGWFSLTDRPTAIVAADDGYARLTMELCREHGLRVPEDMAVTGFNGVRALDWGRADYTTARQPLREMGELAVMQLMRMIEGQPAEMCRSMIQPLILAGHTTMPGRTVAEPLDLPLGSQSA